MINNSVSAVTTPAQVRFCYLIYQLPVHQNIFEVFNVVTKLFIMCIIGQWAGLHCYAYISISSSM